MGKETVEGRRVERAKEEEEEEVRDEDKTNYKEKTRTIIMIKKNYKKKMILCSYLL